LREQIGWVREDLHYSMDFDWFLRLARLARVKRLEEHIGIFRMYPSQKGAFRDERGENLRRLRDDYLRTSKAPMVLWKAMINAYRTWCRVAGTQPRLSQLPYLADAVESASA
jgi:hypothetical protein